MKVWNTDPFLRPLLVALIGSLLVGRAPAQTFTTLHSFTALNSDGSYPYASLILSGNTLYGSTQYGAMGDGTVFAINSDGTDFETLHSFTAPSYYANTNGSYPGGLILSGNTLYGTTQAAVEGGGTVFKVNTDGTGFTTLHSFPATSGFGNTNSDGSYPWGNLILSGKTLYGTAVDGGNWGKGTVFSLNTDGTGFTTVHSFTAFPSYSSPTNGDGANPYCRLILSGNILYGTTGSGGSSGNGTVFSVNVDGTGFTTLHSFAATFYHFGPNIDGAYPHAGLVLSGNTLYGTTVYGGNSGNGTVFAVNTSGASFTTLHNFTETSFAVGAGTNSDGGHPGGNLILSGKTLYGTASEGGSSGNGTVFSLNTDGTRFRALYSFTEISTLRGPNSDGANPRGALILSGNTLYGTALFGGSSGRGTVFSISLPRPLTISCPPPLVLECTREGAVGTFDVNVADSSDSPVVVVWVVDGTPYQTNTVPSGGVLTLTNLTFAADFGLGEHLVTVSAANGETAPATCSMTVQVRDTIPPQIVSVSATPNLLWPPNHQMVPVTIAVQATDNCGPTSSKIVAVTSNEAIGSLREGSDWLITGDLRADLRAERLGRGQGRIYSILVKCDDVAGNSSLRAVTVAVPHD